MQMLLMDVGCRFATTFLDSLPSCFRTVNFAFADLLAFPSHLPPLAPAFNARPTRLRTHFAPTSHRCAPLRTVVGDTHVPPLSQSHHLSPARKSAPATCYKTGASEKFFFFIYA